MIYFLYLCRIGKKSHLCKLIIMCLFHDLLYYLMEYFVWWCWIRWGNDWCIHIVSISFINDCIQYWLYHIKCSLGSRCWCKCIRLSLVGWGWDQCCWVRYVFIQNLDSINIFYGMTCPDCVVIFPAYIRAFVLVWIPQDEWGNFFWINNSLHP